MGFREQMNIVTITLIATHAATIFKRSDLSGSVISEAFGSLKNSTFILKRRLLDESFFFIVQRRKHIKRRNTKHKRHYSSRRSLVLDLHSFSIFKNGAHKASPHEDAREDSGEGIVEEEGRRAGGRWCQEDEGDAPLQARHGRGA